METHVVTSLQSGGGKPVFDKDIGVVHKQVYCSRYLYTEYKYC
jgi:hypothetical protein